MGLARDVLADVVACQQLLALSEVKGYERAVNGRVEQVRGYEKALEGESAHEHIGMPVNLLTSSVYGLADYKNQGYQWMNPYLRAGSHQAAAQIMNGLPPERNARMTISFLDDAFQHAPATTKPVVVYRGTRGFLPGRITPGTVLSDRAYMSSTTDQATARRFAASGAGLNPKIVRITVPPGERMVSMKNLIDNEVIRSWDPHSKDSDEEHEVLLPRNRSLKITAVHGDVVEAELLPAEEPAAAPEPKAAALTPAQQALAKALAYKKARQVAATMALSRTKPDRSDRYVWQPGDIQVTRLPAPIP
jgi:hypothetical protein